MVENILFVCSGNAGRSLSAEFCVRTYTKERKLSAQVKSRGANVTTNAPDAQLVGLLPALSSYRPRQLQYQLQGNDIKWADLILTMDARHRDKVLELQPSAMGKTYLLRDYAYHDSTDVEDQNIAPLPSTRNF
jgi:protein-tyrosine-phosphatase